MIKNSVTILLVSIVLSAFFTPFISLAADPVSLTTNPAARTIGADGGIGSGDPNQSRTFQLVPCTGVKSADGSGKECDFADLLLLARRIIQFVLYIITPIVVGMVLYTGFKYMTAGGDAKLIADAKRMFTPIIIGVFFIFAAWILVYTVLDRLLATQIGDIKKEDIVPSTVRSTTR